MRTSRKNSEQDGFVSIAVLLIVVLLAVVLLEFNFESRMNLRSVDNSYRSQQALACAEAGINIAIAAIGQYDDALSVGPVAEVLTGEVDIPIGEGFCSIRVTGENGRLNINLLQEDGSIDRQRIDQMLALIDALNREYGESVLIGYGMVPAIVDWTDEDDEVTYLPFIKRENEGAEGEYYEGLDPSYSCKNGRFDTLDEVLLVKGMTRDIFNGRPGHSGEGIEPVPGMHALLTVYGDGKIDLNHAPVQVIESLSEDIDFSVAATVVAYREVAPFAAITDLLNVPGITPSVYAKINKRLAVKPQSRYYRVTVTGVIRDIERVVSVVARRDGDGKVKVVLREEP